MATVSDNMDEIEALITQASEFDFTSPGTQGAGLGNELLDIVAEGVYERSMNQQAAPDGTDWADNAESYKKRPEKDGKPISVLDGEMMSMVELRGERTIEPYEASMEYGTQKITRRKAQWFTRGSEENAPDDIEYSGAKDQPPRPFYEIDDTITGQVNERVQQALGEHISGL